MRDMWISLFEDQRVMSKSCWTQATKWTYLEISDVVEVVFKFFQASCLMGQSTMEGYRHAIMFNLLPGGWSQFFHACIQAFVPGTTSLTSKWLEITTRLAPVFLVYKPHRFWISLTWIYLPYSALSPAKILLTKTSFEWSAPWRTTLA